MACLFQDPDIHTLVVGAAFPTDFDAHYSWALVLQEHPSREWLQSRLQPHVHYLPVREDLDDLEKATRKGEHYLVEKYFDDMFSFGNFTAYSEYNWLAKELKAKIVKKVCEKGIGYDGDQLEAGSPMDPSFWPLHPTMERLWLFKKLAGGFTDEAWPSVDYATVDGCHGHKAGDVIPFRFSLKTQSSLSDGSSDPNSAVPNNQTKYTNEELYNYMASGSPDMPYVYQDFNWDHCNSVALNTSYDFAGLVTSWQQSTGLPNARA